MRCRRADHRAPETKISITAKCATQMINEGAEEFALDKRLSLDKVNWGTVRF